jgi:hypothetical protein
MDAAGVSSPIGGQKNQTVFRPAPGRFGRPVGRASQFASVIRQ